MLAKNDIFDFDKLINTCFTLINIAHSSPTRNQNMAKKII